MRVFPLLLLLPLLLPACEPAEDTAEAPAAEPWHDLPDTELEPLRRILSVDIVASQRLRSIPGQPALAAWPRGDGYAMLLDGRYRSAPQSVCIGDAVFPAFTDGQDRRGDCAADEIELDRGRLGVGSQVVDVVYAPDLREVHALADGGLVRRANADVREGNPYDFYRLGTEVRLSTAAGPALQIVPVAAGGWWARTSISLVRFSATGIALSEESFPATVDLVGSGEFAWLATSEGLVRSDGLSLPLPGVTRVASDGAGGVWVSQRGVGVVQAGSDGLGGAVAVPDATGPVAVDSRTGRVYVGVTGGFAVLDGATEVARLSTSEVLDIAVNQSHEIAVLDSSGVITVYFDETALVGAPPLDIWVAAFIENPRQVATVVDCEGDAAAVVSRMERAATNRRWLDNIPATVALGVTPAVAAHAQRCDVPSELGELAQGNRISPGALFHDAPDCDDDACLATALAEDVGQLALADIEPRWMGGAAGWETGADWVQGLLSLDLPPVLTFFGMSLLPEVGIEDPRAKDAWPFDAEASAGAWHIADGDSADVDTPSATLHALPGATLAAFNLDSCAGVFQAECRVVGRGGGSEFGGEDRMVLDLLVRRALAHRPTADESARGTWYFHLPAIEEYDYTEGCRESDGLWTGGTCAAGYLQGWANDVETRFVRAGIAEWSTP